MKTPKSLRPTHNYPKMAVAGNLPRNINILETFDDNKLVLTIKRVSPLGFGGYPNSTLPLIISFSLTSWARCYSCSCIQFGLLLRLHVLLSAMLILLF